MSHLRFYHSCLKSGGEQVPWRRGRPWGGTTLCLFDELGGRKDNVQGESCFRRFEVPYTVSWPITLDTRLHFIHIGTIRDAICVTLPLVGEQEAKKKWEKISLHIVY